MKTFKTLTIFFSLLILSPLLGGEKIEGEKIILKSPKGKGTIEIGFNESGDPIMSFSDKEGKERLSFFGGKNPRISIKNAKDKIVAELFETDDIGFFHFYDEGKKSLVAKGGKNGGISLFDHQERELSNWSLVQSSPQLNFFDDRGISRLQFAIMGNDPSILFKNIQNKVIGSWSTLHDGSMGLGLADPAGLAAAILRGGKTPAMSFFTEKGQSAASLGVVQHIPHLLVSGSQGNEGILIHGGQASGVMIVDETGKLKLFLSKKGIFQGKTVKQEKETKTDKKLFSFEEDQETLFPDQKSVR